MTNWNALFPKFIILQIAFEKGTEVGMIKCYWKMKYNELITDQIMLNASKWNQFALNDMNVSQFVELEIQKRIEM